MTQEEYNQFLDNILFSRLQNYIIRARLEEVTQGFVYIDDFLKDLYNYFWSKYEEFEKWFKKYRSDCLWVSEHEIFVQIPEYYVIGEYDNIEIGLSKLAKMSRGVNTALEMIVYEKEQQLKKMEEDVLRLAIEHKQLKGGASTTETKQKDKGEDKGNVCLIDLLPEELRVPEAVEVFQRAIDQGFIKQNNAELEWNKTKGLLTIFAEEMNKLIGLNWGLQGNKIKQVWAPYEDLFKVKQLAQAKKDYTRTGCTPKGTDEVIKLFNN